MFHVPEEYRNQTGRLRSTRIDGNNGAFTIVSPIPNRVLYIIASDGLSWEHVSVHVLQERKLLRTPNWTEMCFVKDLFWDDEDVVMQLHPKKSEYVNNHPNVLHLWRPINLVQVIPTPPYELVGIK
jgi:hypothetical protein